MDDEDDRAAVLAAMEDGKLTNLLLRPFTVQHAGTGLLPALTADAEAAGAVPDPPR